MVGGNQVQRFDVIVVGAGPGGAMTAKELAAKGFKVLLLDKQVFPRYKVCGGAVSAKAQELLDFPLEEVSLNSVRQAHLGVYRSISAEVELDSPFIYMVMRAEFDQRLVQSAINQGVEFRAGEEFRTLTRTGDGVAVQTSVSAYQARFVVGADGVYSTVRSELNLGWQPRWGFALEGEYSLQANNLSGVSDWPDIDLGFPEHGYCWLFPKGDTLSIGLGTFAPHLPEAKAKLAGYLDSKGLSGLQPSMLRGYPLPADGAVRKRLHSDLGLVVGDAAGLADPLTGEGIYFALRSGQIAAEELGQALNADRTDLKEYSARIYQEITKDLRRGERLAPILFKHSEFLVKLLVGKPERGRLLINVVYGKLSYQALWAIILKRLARKGWRKCTGWLPRAK